MVKKGWQEYKFADICEIVAPLVDPKLPEYRKLPHIGNENIQKGTGRLLQYRSAEDDQVISGKYLFSENEFLYAKIRPYFAKVAFPQFTGLCSADIYPIRCKDGFSPSFMKYIFLTKSFTDYAVAQSMRSSGMPKVNRADLKNAYFTLPTDKKEQEAIATALFDVDKLITNLEKLIEKKKNIMHGVMQELLTGKRRLPGFINEWTEHEIGKLGVFYSGLSGKTKEDFGHGNAKFIPFMNVLYNTIIDADYLESVVVGEYENQNRVQRGDLFFNTSSETPEEVGMCCVLNDDLANTYLNSFCFGFRIADQQQYMPLYLSYFFNSPYGREKMLFLAQGSTRYNLSKTNFAKLKISIPPQKEQKAIVSILFDMDNEIDTLEKRLAKYRQLKQGMMQKLLTGEIRLV